MSLPRILFFIILSLPIYFIGKYLERRLKPRDGFRNFFLWLSLVIATSFIYFVAVMFIIIRIIGVKNFR